MGVPEPPSLGLTSKGVAKAGGSGSESLLQRSSASEG